MRLSNKPQRVYCLLKGAAKVVTFFQIILAFHAYYSLGSIIQKLTVSTTRQISYTNKEYMPIEYQIISYRLQKQQFYIMLKEHRKPHTTE